jgi:hypothetical protein
MNMWEMLHSAKLGDEFEASPPLSKHTILVKNMDSGFVHQLSYAAFGISVGDTLTLSRTMMNLEWKRYLKPVDFETAWKALMNGKDIASLVENTTDFNSSYGPQSSNQRHITFGEMRGKWVII